MDGAKKSEETSVAALNARLDAMSAQLAYLVERQRRIDALIEESGPVLKAVMSTASEQLDVLDKKGYFAFGRELVRMGDRVIERFSPDDVRQLAGAAGSILDTVRELTRPEVLRVAADAAQGLQHADDAQPIGLFGMVRATGDQDVQRGMAVMMDVMRHVGRAASVAVAQRRARPMEQKRAKLDTLLGARSKKALGTERTPAPPHPAHVAAAKAGPPPASTMLDGIAFGPDGHMLDASAWTREVGEKIAAMQGVVLGDAHWKVVEFARADYAATKAAPNIRRLTQQMGVATKDLYGLFPKAPGRTIAKIAGLPKPAGCL